LTKLPGIGVLLHHGPLALLAGAGIALAHRDQSSVKPFNLVQFGFVAVIA
jgi:energy-converting hydrogenase Eha subunit C